MTIKLIIEGEIKTKEEKIQAELITPENWKPAFVESTEVLGVIKFLIDKYQEIFLTIPKNN